jgi:hypothetical protein
MQNCEKVVPNTENTGANNSSVGMGVPCEFEQERKVYHTPDIRQVVQSRAKAARRTRSFHVAFLFFVQSCRACYFNLGNVQVRMRVFPHAALHHLSIVQLASAGVNLPEIYAGNPLSVPAVNSAKTSVGISLLRLAEAKL